MTSRLGLIVASLVVVTILAWQQRSISKLRSTVEQSGAVATTVSPAPPADRRPSTRSEPARPAKQERDPFFMEDVALEDGASKDGALTRRVAALEYSVAALSKGAEHLMDRGEIPPSNAKASEWRAKFLDSTQSARDRMSALRMLRRNGLFDEQMAQTCAFWMSSLTNTDEQRVLLENLRGADSPALKQAMLGLASTSEDARVRERAISNLRSYLDDPQVETELWQMLSSESSRDVVRRIEDTLRRIPMNEMRAATLKAEARNPNAPLEKRLASLRILQSGKQDIADVAFQLAQAAEGAADSQSRLQFIEAFDDINDPEFMAPLVTAAQDEDANVRARAADALVDYRNEPVISEWLVHLAENDPDPRVRQEASRVYREDGRRDGRWRN